MVKNEVYSQENNHYDHPAFPFLGIGIIHERGAEERQAHDDADC